jgi:hypothetical protein
MIFGNPLAWLGLGALVLPLVVHMLVRERARVQRLPTLRFLRGEPPVAIRRSRPDEPLLLALRLLLLAVAVFALAQPFLVVGERGAQADGIRDSLSRVVLLDRGEAGVPVGEEFEALEALLAGAAGTAERVRVIPFDGRPGAPAARDLAAGVEGARGWLEGAPGRREVVVVSDFSAGLPDEGALHGALRGALRGIPDEVGIRLVAAPGAASASDARLLPPSWTLPARSGTVEATWSVEAEEAEGAPGADDRVPGAWVRWTPANGAPGSDVLADGLTLVSGADPAARERAGRALDAAAAVGGLRVGAGTPVIVVLGGGASGPEGSALLAAAGPPTARWTGDALLRLGRDPELVAALRESGGAAATADAPEAPFEAPVPLFRGHEGQVVLGAGELPPEPGGDGASPRLLLVYTGDPGDLAAAALLGAVGRAVAAPAFAGGAGPAPTAEALERWQRDPAPASGTTGTGGAAGGPLDDTDSFPSDARWAWLMVLGLLVGEGFLRRRIQERRSTEASDDEV